MATKIKDSQGRPAVKRGSKWGVESEFTRALRERQLEQVITIRCDLCKVSVRYSAKRGIEWFKRHRRTPKHKAAIKAAKRST